MHHAKFFVSLYHQKLIFPSTETLNLAFLGTTANSQHVLDANRSVLMAGPVQKLWLSEREICSMALGGNFNFKKKIIFALSDSFWPLNFSS